METQSPLNKSTKESGLCVGPVMVNKVRRYMKTYDLDGQMTEDRKV